MVLAPVRNVYFASFEDRKQSNRLMNQTPLYDHHKLTQSIDAEIKYQVPWYFEISLLLPWLMPRLVKLPHKINTRGINSASMHIAKILFKPSKVAGWSSHTSDRQWNMRSGCSRASRPSISF